MDFLLQFPQQHAAKKAVDTCTLCIPFVNVWRYGKKKIYMFHVQRKWWSIRTHAVIYL